MWLHYCIAGGLVAITILLGEVRGGTRQKAVSPLFAAFLLIGAVATFRAPSVGNDTLEYHRVFKEIAGTTSYQEAIQVSRFEHGYVLVNYLVSRITDNFNILLLLVAACYLASVMLFIQRYAYSNSLALLTAFGMSVFYDFMITARQCIAVALFLCAVPALLERRPVRYAAFIVLASQFHSLALVVLLAYFVPTMRLNDFGHWLRFGVVVLGATSAMGLALARIGAISPYYGHYMNSVYAEGGVRLASILGGLVRVFMIALAATCGWQASVRADRSRTQQTLVALAGVDLGIVIASLGFNLVDRFEMYFTLPFVVGLINVVARDRTISGTVVSFCMVAAAFVQMTVILLFRPEWSNLIPYHTVFEVGTR
ncbi:EpsG family protein [Actinomyces ruminicola]|uniref:EpsG family protein n=1 Tax=Actinomyces ruminicola TaxID=332524 RepID=A0A1G9TVQ8_9ACTO|nr:EpsG family protein [Actinomyces ruminicola]SDM51732.1 EpsG family protein [Actinomyces ruminicola]